ncbi:MULTISPECIES: hypothetical protein [unclassified Salinisphaera]|uniref:hypothetical protein n=1 Tax=unclassified Salinisphaera TaxID=2649847 RepID=UPI003340661E
MSGLKALADDALFAGLNKAWRVERLFMNSTWRKMSGCWRLVKHEMVRLRDGFVSLLAEPVEKMSPFDVPGVKTKASTSDILSAVSDSRAR